MNGVVVEAARALDRAGIGPGSTVLVAVSGGPDSTALFRALVALRGSALGTVTACIVDHGIRPQSEIQGDIGFAADLCAAHRISLAVKTVPPGFCEHNARSAHSGLEEAARTLRHRLLHEAAREAGAAWIALGHTEDDDVETLLMRVLQGSDIQGLSGIPPVRAPFIRPLLGCARVEVEAYLRSLGQGWRNDASNDDHRFLRNRVRHLLVPVLESSFPGYRTGLLALREKIALAADLVAYEDSRLRWQRTEQGYSIGADEFLATAPSVRVRSLLTLWDELNAGAGTRRLPWRFLRPVLTRTELPLSGILLKGHGMELGVRHGRVTWEVDIASRCKLGYFIFISEACGVALRGTGKKMTVSRCALGSAEDGPGGGISILAVDVQPPLVLRSLRKGDAILLDAGMTPVVDVLAAWKVTPSRRDRVPILIDTKGVLAVLGGALGFPSRARAGAGVARGAAVDRMVIRIENELEEGCEQQQR